MFFEVLLICSPSLSGHHKKRVLPLILSLISGKLLLGMWFFLKYKTLQNGEKESLSIQSFIRDYFLPVLRKLYEGGRDDVV